MKLGEKYVAIRRPATKEKTYADYLRDAGYADSFLRKVRSRSYGGLEDKDIKIIKSTL